MVSPAAGLTAIKTIPTIELILIVGMVLYIDNEFYVIQILESFYVEIIIFPVIFDGQTPMLSSIPFHYLIYSIVLLILSGIQPFQSEKYTASQDLWQQDNVYTVHL